MKKLSDRRIAAFFSLVLASGLCVALLAVRVRYPHGSDFEFLTWNLFLAWIPFVLAVVLHDGARRGRGTGLPRSRRRCVAPVPPERAVHRHRLRPRRPGERGAGLVRRGDDRLVRGRRARARAGLDPPRPGRGRAAVRCGRRLADAGARLLPLQRRIYIGRVHRLNSWDAITSPGTLLRGFADRLADPLAQPEAIVALVGAMGLLTVAYLVLYTISDLRLDRVSAPTAARGRLGYGSWRSRTVVPPASVRSSRRTPGRGSG